MKGFEDEVYRYLWLLSNVTAIFLLFITIKWPRIGRVLFFLLFAWASWMNWTTAIEKPSIYLDYGRLTWSSVYRNFIYGWFSMHITEVVKTIATGQVLIATGILLNGWIMKISVIAAIVFLLAIVPLGIGSGFPTTLIMTIALMALLRKHSSQFIWRPSME
ncbi:MAG: hypothetical protein QM764_21720 [Chitinophagaceae bacterium]